MKYPSAYEIEEVLNDRLVTRTSIINFAQTRGIILTRASKEELVKELSSYLYEYSDLEEIREMAYKSTNKQMLSGFTIVPEKDLDLEILYDRIREYGQLQGKGYSLNAISRIKEGDQLIYKGEITYTKRKSGKIQFVQGEKYSTDFSFFCLPDNTWQVEVDGTSSSDGKEVMKLMSMMLEGKSVDIVTLNDSDLGDNIVLFFDKLAKEGFDPKIWTFIDIKQLTFKRKKTISEVEDDEDESDFIEEDVDDKYLGGISQAVLDGRNLREHPFVQSAEKSGCIFTAMTYEFQGTNSSNLLVIKAEFKGSPKIFEVSVINQGVITGAKGNKKRYDNADPKFKKEKASQFWNSAKRIYNDLIKQEKE